MTPDGDATVAVADPAQPEVSTPASDPVESAPVAETTPPVVEEPTPGSDASDEFVLDDDTLDAIFEVGGDKLFDSPKVKERIDRQAQTVADRAIAERASTPDHDAEYRRNVEAWQGAANSRQEAVNRLVPMVQQALAGEDVDQRTIAALTSRAIEASQAAETAGINAVSQSHRVTIAATMNDLFGSNGDTVIGKDRAGNPLTLNAAYDNALRAYESGVANRDPKAGPELARRALAMARETAYAMGKQAGEAQALKKTAASTKLATDAAIKEVKAKAAARTLGQTAPTTTGSPARTVTYDQLQKMTADQINALPGDVFEKAVAGG